ncbi:PadR family transcriptional regulator [Acinetobacter populi]|jgi:DNA-binding PadR family transcriptional regulator|uniref:PadR family transcriptional regulator n=1 Tax=Acinetobacter populi TaxID=1582270 RepID=A0A1Z9YY15_9GAMM|nr:PadR family transcriptional regulator [Acinetobacter populi]MCH4249025.1 PadR family transcriptional regulator [Acinetobacter populi]OUY07099.1 PadR family transcriptional regulator [Acinetobacter populi]
MSLSHVLLTSLLEKPSTGIALARRFDRSMGFFWHATHQQIYRELGQMQNKGWISTIETEDTDSRKKTYQVEDIGKQELYQWILQESQPAKFRDELMVKLRAEAQLGGDLILPELKRHLTLHRTQHDLYKNIFAKDQQKQSNGQTRTVMIQQKILELGIQLEAGWIVWIEEMIDILQQDHDSKE